MMKIFSYALPKPSGTFYQTKFGLNPDACREHINSAMKKPGLEEGFLINIKKKLTGEMSEEDHETSQIVSNLDIKIKSCKEKDKEINDKETKLSDPKIQEKYDSENPPCSLLKIKEHHNPLYEGDSNIINHVLRSELTSFYSKICKTSLPHPSDFTRTDFSNDFYKNDILDK